MDSSSTSWEPYQLPNPWHLRASGGAVHSITTGQSATGRFLESTRRLYFATAIIRPFP